MNYKTLILVGALWLSPAFAAASYTCSPLSEEETALLGDELTFVTGEDGAVLQSEAIGECDAEEGELSGDRCKVGDTVGVAIDESLNQEEAYGYLKASTEDDEASYYCESDRR